MSAAGAWKLIIEDDGGNRQTVPIRRDIITIGRKEGNNIRLTDRNVSRNHAKLSKENGHLVLEDLSSYNGIKLNGERISGRVIVNQGDTFQIGDYHLALDSEDGAQERAASNSATIPQHKSTAAHPSHKPQQEDDEFAGDTQRWDPPANLQPISVSPPTQEEPKRPSISEETAPGPIATVSQFGPGAKMEGPLLDGDTMRVPPAPLSSGLSGLDAGAPSPIPSRKNDQELEPTMRTPSAIAAPAPISVPGGQHVGLGPTEPARPAIDPSTMAPKSAPAEKVSLAQPTERLERAKLQTSEERTEQVKASPAVLEDLATPRLVVLNTIFAGSTFALRAQEQVIGRTDDNDITIEHRSVSRNHAKLVREGDRVRIMDLKSANGVLVNGDEVEAAILKPGDVIELGRVRLRFVPPGERYVVPPEEVERARIADAAGDDFDSDGGTGITNPVRQKKPDELDFGVPRSSIEKKKNPMVLIGVGALAVIAIVAIIAVVANGGDDEQEKTPPPAPPPVTALATPPPPPVETAPPPAEVKPEAVDVQAEAVEAKPETVEVQPQTADTPDAVEEKGEDTSARPRDKRKPPPKPSPGDAVTQAKMKILRGDFAGAVKDLEPFAKSNDAQVHRTLGVAYAKLKNNTRATHHYRKYLDLAPNASDADEVRAALEGAKSK